MKKFTPFLLVFMLGCQTGRLTSLDTKPTEAVVFGRVLLDNNYPLPKDQVVVHFNSRISGKHAVWMDKEGYFCTKLPLGKNFIALLEYRGGLGFFRNILENHVSVEITAPDKIYYIGDISFEWSPSESDQRGGGQYYYGAGLVGSAISGAAQSIRESKKDQGDTPVYVAERPGTILDFKQQFPDNQWEIVTEVVTIAE